MVISSFRFLPFVVYCLNQVFLLYVLLCAAHAYKTICITLALWQLNAYNEFYRKGNKIHLTKKKKKKTVGSVNVFQFFLLSNLLQINSLKVLSAVSDRLQLPVFFFSVCFCYRLLIPTCANSTYLLCLSLYLTVVLGWSIWLAFVDQS